MKKIFRLSGKYRGYGGSKTDDAPASVMEGSDEEGDLDKLHDNDFGDGSPTSDHEILADGKSAKQEEEVELKKGDYQLKVHIIECLELLPLTGAGIVDPIVFVEILGQKMHTKQKRKCNSCIFDECFNIPLLHMNQSMIEDGTISISVLDCSSSLSSLMSNNTIGTFNTDLESVYHSPGHEAYRQWIPLFSSSRSGITGKMMITLELLGPGDKSVVHDRKAELVEEKKQRKRTGAEISPSMTLSAQFPQKLNFLVVEIFKAEGIPVLDKSLFGGKVVNHISAYVAVEFDRHERVHTDSAKLTRAHYNDADFLTAMWLPFMEPSFSSRIQLRVVEHHSVTANEVMCTGLSGALQLKHVKQATEGKFHRDGSAPDPTHLFWVNLYGAPVPELTSGGETKKVEMNMYPDSASAYRGRLLVRLRIDENKPNNKGKKRGPDVLKFAITPGYLKAQPDADSASNDSDGSWFHVSPASSTKDSRTASPTKGTKSLTPLAHKSSFGSVLHLGGGGSTATHVPAILVTSAPPAPVLHHNGESPKSTQAVRASMNSLGASPTALLGLPMPKTAKFVLKALVFAGQAFPQGNFIKSKRFSVELRLMHRRLITPVARMEDGYVMWNEAILLSDTFELPIDPCMMPDLFLYVLNKELEPLCYKKYSLADLLAKPEEKQFNSVADWEIMKIDKSFSSTPKDIFPGAVLLKLGFGREELSRQHRWQTHITTTCAVNQVNIHIYQGRGLPPSDSNGLLDPYMLVRLGTHIIKTKVHKKTRDPQFMETLSFQMKLPVNDDLKPQLFLELFDQDLGGDDFVGLLKLDLALADKRTISTDKRTMRLKEPEWYSLRSKQGADLMGQILLGYEILTVDPSAQPSAGYFGSEPKLIPSPDLHPPCTSWTLDMTILGLRDLEPAGMLPIYKPYMAVLFHGSELRKLPPSKKPTATDPNFLCRFEEDLMLPENVVFAPTLAISAKDRKIKGLKSGAVIGSCSIPLDGKMMAFNRAHSGIGGEAGSEVIPVRRMHFRSGNPYLSQEDLISTQIVLNDSYSTQLEDVCRWEDGPEAAVSTEDQRVACDKVISAALSVLQNANKDDLAEYLQGRLSFADELERVMVVPPFERYPLTTGSVASTVENAMDTAFCQVGVLKCIVNITPHDISPTTTSETAGTSGAASSSALIHGKKSHLTPIKLVEEDVKIRLYILQGNNLAGHDDDNLSDPYLIVKFGNKKISTRDRHKRNTRDPRFFEVFEFSSKLPGINDIKISVKDHNDVFTDELIGATVIDIEDRWFCSEWKDLCTKGATLAPPSSTSSTPFTPSIEPRAPLERRSLYNPKSSAPQGTLTMWLDVLSVEDAKKFPKKNITPPPTEEWELRVIVWSAEDVPCGDPFEGMNDLYVKCSLGGDKYQSTDTHLRLQTGHKGSFNWRMKFPLSLPVSEYDEGGTRLFIQAWDMDFITSSDCLGSVQLDLSDTFDKAQRKRNRRLKAGKSTNFVHQHFYDTKASQQARKSKTSLTSSNGPTYWSRLTSYLQCCACSFAWCSCPCCACSWCCWAKKNVPGDNLDSDLETGLGGSSATERTPLITSSAKSEPTRSASYSAIKPTTDKAHSDDGLIRDRQEEEEDDDQDDLDLPDNAKPADGGDQDIETGGGGKGKNKEETGERRRKKKKPLTLYGNAMQAMGMVPSKIEHAQEVQLFTSDQLPAGKVLMSISLMHHDVAHVLRAGEGRGEPNAHPTLPDPEGRIDFTKMWNPFYMCRVCAGDKIFAELACVFSCLAFFLVYYFIGQPILTLFMVLKEFFGMWMVYLLLVALLLGGALLYYYLRNQLRKVCCGKSHHGDDSDDEDD